MQVIKLTLQTPSFRESLNCNARLFNVSINTNFYTRVLESLLFRTSVWLVFRSSVGKGSVINNAESHVFLRQYTKNSVKR